MEPLSNSRGQILVRCVVLHWPKATQTNCTGTEIKRITVTLRVKPKSLIHHLYRVKHCKQANTPRSELTCQSALAVGCQCVATHASQFQ